MSDPQNHGLDELSQRLQAMAEAQSDPRLRPFQGAPLPIGPSGGRTPAYGAFEDVRVSPPPPPPPVNLPAPPPAPAYGAQYPSPSTSYQASAPSPVQASPVQASPVQTSPYRAPSYQTSPYPSATPAPAEPFGEYAHAPGASNGSSPATSSFGAFGYNPPAHSPTPAASATLPESSPAPSPAHSPTAAPVGESAAPPSSLPATAEDSKTAQTGLQRAVHAIRTAIPIVQRLLPLLDGNFATVLSNLVTQQPHHPPPAPQVRVDLEPVNRGLAEVRDSQRELATQVQEQGTSLKRVEDHLERVREATDRNTLEQQELVEDLRTVGSRLSLFAIIGLVLLGLSLALNIFFLIQLQHILR
jgi:hypothetical protein